MRKVYELGVDTEARQLTIQQQIKRNKNQHEDLYFKKKCSGITRSKERMLRILPLEPLSWWLGHWQQPWCPRSEVSRSETRERESVLLWIGEKRVCVSSSLIRRAKMRFNWVVRWRRSPLYQIDIGLGLLKPWAVFSSEN
jgi:hypothetical protein